MNTHTKYHPQSADRFKVVFSLKSSLFPSASDNEAVQAYAVIPPRQTEHTQSCFAKNTQTNFRNETQTQTRGTQTKDTHKRLFGFLSAHSYAYTHEKD
jgi:hypothetical protein